MKLEHFVKSLKVGKCLRLETAGEKYILIELGRTDEGKYHFIFESHNELEIVDDVFFSKEYETADELLDYIAKHFADWFEYDFEIHKTRAELKAENAQLKKALKMACNFVDCRRIFRDRPCEDRIKGRDCTEIIFEYLMKEAAKK